MLEVDIHGDINGKDKKSVLTEFNPYEPALEIMVLIT